MLTETSGFSGAPSLPTSWSVTVWGPSFRFRCRGASSVSSAYDALSSRTRIWPSFGTPAGPPGATRTKFVTRNESVESVPTSAPSRGKTIERPGVPPAGPRVTITATDAVTSGFRDDPLSVTSCNRIACGPEGRARTIVLTLAFAVRPPSTKTSTWPESGEDVPLPGSVRLKFVTAKTTTTGVPLPITAFGLGETIDRVGGGAARPFEAAIPETMISPTVARTKARIRPFTISSPRSLLGIPPVALRGLGRDFSAPQNQDDQDECQKESDSTIGDQRQAHGGGRDDVNRHGRRRRRIRQDGVVVVRQSHPDRDVPLGQRNEEDGLVLDDLHDHLALDEKLDMAFVRGVRLAPRLDQREILNPIRHVDPVTRRFERRRR